jgi:hypothetical protein
MPHFFISLCLILFLTLSYVRDGYTLETSILHEEEVLILYEEPLRGAAEEVAQIYPAARKELEKDLLFKGSLVVISLLPMPYLKKN